MPIRPENRHRYPADWQEIRARILARAGDRCERCQAPNLTLVHRYAASPERWVRANPLPRCGGGTRRRRVPGSEPRRRSRRVRRDWS